MKKSTLALSVAAALGGLGFASNALAIGTVAGATGTTLTVNNDGIGHQLVFPYFSTQSDNATLLNITNTDTTNGKIVKVRFRGAANSDDLFDFQVLLSPGDVWTASVTKDAASGASTLSTSDKTCVLPASVSGSVFATSRVDPTPALGSSANETREGYVEVINMADISVTTSDLYKTTKHKSGVPDCDATILDTALGSDVATVGDALTRGFTPPSGGLTGDWIILNQVNTAAWSGAATALAALDANRNRLLGNLVFWPQKFGTPTNAIANNQGFLASNVSADPLFQGTAPVVKPQNYDLPDLSTPYVTADTTAAVRALDTSTQLAVKTVKNQYVSNPGIHAVTDLLFTQPTRRYAVAVDYTKSAASSQAVYNAAVSTFYNTTNTQVVSRQVCLNTLSAPGVQGLFDREETSPTVGSTNFVISPNTPATIKGFTLCGEAAVASINAGGVSNASALTASVVRNDVTFGTAYVDGWASWDLTNGGPGLPVLGGAFVRASNGAVNYGFLWTHKVTRPSSTGL